MNETLLNALINSGTLGIIAAIILLWKREDDKARESSLTALIAQYERTLQQCHHRFERLTTETNRQLRTVARVLQAVCYHTDTANKPQPKKE